MIPLTGTGGLFTRLGRLAGILKATASHQQTSIAGGIGALTSVYGSLPSPIAALTRAAVVPSAGAGQVLANLNLEALIVDAARRTLVEMAKADQPNESWDVPKAVAEVIRQMKATGQTVPACTVSYTLSNSPVFANPGEANAGDGTVLVGLYQPNYVLSENAFAEQLRLAVSDDSEIGSEVWTVRGAVTASGPFNYDWPGGSGSVSSLVTCDPAGDPGTGDGQTILEDGSFEEWDDSTTLTNWTDVACLRTSTAGQVYNVFSGETRYAVSFVGVPSGYAASVTQVLDPDLIKGSTVYGIAFRVRLADSASNISALTTVTIQAELQDASDGTVLTDVGGNALRISKTYTATTDVTWNLVSGVIVTPRRMPAAVNFVIKTGTLTFTPHGSYYALFHVDHAALWPMKFPYPGGPALGVVAGNRPWKEGDSLEVAIENDRAGALFGFTWQAVFDRFFGDRVNFLYLPTSASPSIGDFLIDPAGVSIPPPPPPPPTASGTLTAHLFLDTNGNGSQGAGELDAAGRAVYVIGPVTDSRFVNDDGDATFTLPPGIYTVLAGVGAGEYETNSGTATVTNGGTVTANRGIATVVPPSPPFWNLTIQTNRPFRAYTAVGPTTYNGFTDASGNAILYDIDGPADETYAVTLDSNSSETAIWSSYSEPYPDAGTGFIADLQLGDGTAAGSQNAVVNFSVSTTDDPATFGRFTVQLWDGSGNPIAARDVTITTYGLTGTTNAGGQVVFTSPLIRRGDIVTITVESSATPVTWSFHNQGTGGAYPGPVTGTGTGYVGYGVVSGSSPGGGTANGLAIWQEFDDGTTTYSISGNVLVDGSPSSAISISLTGDASATAETDLDGNYIFTGLAAGTYAVAPTSIPGGQTWDPVSYTGIVITTANITGRNFDVTTA